MASQIVLLLKVDELVLQANSFCVKLILQQSNTTGWPCPSANQQSGAWVCYNKCVVVCTIA